eukprot:CAMPEP_0181097612 /NCGR_PEP_ID=MMETSP1071-20121207/11663_1 /TAXON_ID=35127 /ORGANISM="Thalassiosira sp., Strain NH16" /LENGTH=977 /DNA_ID=CAMNT_0023180107 /DNA_START=11 /DNA_END=2940 /DNA_ORIENTATION=-
MPIPPIIPIPPHLLLPGPAALATVRAAAGAATSRASAAGASSLLASALAANLWKQVPEWIREDESWLAIISRNSRTDRGGGDGGDGGSSDPVFVDEMASLTAVIQKLEALVATGYDKLGSQRRMGRRRRTVSRHANESDAASEIRQRASFLSLSMKQEEGDGGSSQISSLEWHAALLAYWQLCNQIRERYPWWRDKMYHRLDGTDRGNNIDVEQEEQLLEAELKEEKSAERSVNCHDETRVNVIDESNSENNDSTNISPQHQTGYTNEENPKFANVGSMRGVIDGNEFPPSNSGPIMTTSQIKELQTMFDYAVWAYEPDEALLRSLLLTGDGKKVDAGSSDDKKYGYQLIVHRTTSYMDPNEKLVPSDNNNNNNNNNKNDATATKKEQKQSPNKQKKNKRKPPGRVGYFVAISHAKRSLLIGMKGTSTLEELLTDCCGRAVRVDLDNDPHHPAVARGDDDESYEDAAAACCDGVESGSDDEKCKIQRSCCSDKVAQSAIDGSNEAFINEKDPSRQDEKCDKDADLISSTLPSPSTGQVSNDELVDMIRVSSSNYICPSESVEVELVHDDKQILPNASIESPRKGISPREFKQDLTTPKKKTSSLLRKVPSENVLLVPSVPDTKQSLTTTPKQIPSSPLQPPVELDHSPSDEFMESNGIEMEENRSQKLRGAHEGILHCAQQLLFEISPLIEEYAVSKGYEVVCTGHSLGAGTAVLLAVLIRGRYPALTELTGDCRGMSCDGDGPLGSDDVFLSKQRVRAYAFAPPPVLDQESALACQHYVISIVNNSDIIPRSSLTNLDVFLTILEAVRSRLVEAGMNPGSSTRNNESSSKPKTSVMASTMALFRKLSEGTNGDLLLEPVSLQKLWEEAVAEASLGESDGCYWDKEFGHHLFAPGKLLMMYESWSKHTTPSETADSVGQLHSLPPLENGRASQGIEETQTPKFHAIWTDGTAAAMKGFEIGAGSSMVTDHLTTSYQR